MDPFIPKDPPYTLVISAVVACPAGSHGTPGSSLSEGIVCAMTFSNILYITTWSLVQPRKKRSDMTNMVDCTVVHQLKRTNVVPCILNTKLMIYYKDRADSVNIRKPWP